MAVSFQLLRSSTASKRPTAANLAAGELGLNFNDDTSGLFYENASGNIMKVGPAEVGTTAPNASPASGGSSGNSLGELWYDSTSSDPQLKIYTGSAFVLAGPKGIVSAADATAITIDSDEKVTLSGALDVTGNADIDGVLNADAVDIDGNTNMAGNLTFSGGATNMVLTDNTAGALDIKEGVTSYLKFDTTNGSELITAAKAVTLSSTLSVAGDVTFSTAQDVGVIDNSGLALRIMESTNEYLRIVTTDGSESVTIKKALHTDGVLEIDNGVTASAQTDIAIADNQGYALRVMESTNEYLRFKTTDGSEEIDLSKALRVDATATINGDITVEGDRALTLDASSSNALDVTISGGNRMMRFNTNTETVLLEQNFEVDGTATFDGAMDIDSTMDISGGDITLSANCDVHIPDNSGQALDIAEGANNYVRFITTDDSEKIEVSQDLDINDDITYSGGDLTFDGSNQQAFFPSNSQYALEMRTTASPFLTFDTRSAHPTLNITAPVGFQLTSTTPTMANSQMTIQLTNDTTLQFTVKGSDGTSRTATLTLS